MTNVEFTSEAIRSAKFKERLRGYPPEEVDAFLERCATALEQLTDRLGEMNARALRAEAALAGNSEADESVRRTLVLAQRTAEMAVRGGQRRGDPDPGRRPDEADRIVTEVKAEAHRVESDATQRAAAIEQDAEQARAAAIEQAAATIDAANSHGRGDARATPPARPRLGVGHLRGDGPAADRRSRRRSTPVGSRPSRRSRNRSAPCASSASGCRSTCPPSGPGSRPSVRTCSKRCDRRTAAPRRGLRPADRRPRCRGTSSLFARAGPSVTAEPGAFGNEADGPR